MNSVFKKYMVLMAAISGVAHLHAEEKPELLVISRTTFGLFSSFFSVIDKIAWCEKNNVTPTVYWGKSSLYYEEGGYNGSENVWEYYFEPISSVKYVPENQDENILVCKEYDSPCEFRLIPQTFTDGYKDHIDVSFRKNVHDIIQRYIKIKPVIMNKIDAFYDKHMAGKKTIGIHIRGTDKHLELKKETPLESLCREANALGSLSSSPCQFLVATDEESLLQEARKLLQGPVIAYDAYRSLNGAPIHDSKHDYSKAKAGEEVVIEVALLSRCDALVHTRSRVSSAVLFFNPEMAHTVIF